MNATVNVLLFKSKTLADGSHPLMIRICKDNKKKYRSLGVSIQPQHWDFEKNKPRRHCPNRETIQTLISTKLSEYSEQIIDFKSENKSFTAKSLVDKVDAPLQARTVKEVFEQQIEQLQASTREYKPLKEKRLSCSRMQNLFLLSAYYFTTKVVTTIL